MDVLDLRLPRAVRAAATPRATRAFETAKVDGRTGHTVHTDRGDLTAPLVVDALGWRRVLSNAAEPVQPPEAASRAAWRSTRTPAARTWSCGWTPSTCAPATAGPSPPATSCASASARSTRATTSRSRRWPSPATCRVAAERYQGNWIPHQMRDGVEDGVFFAGDSAGHCLPTTAEGIRTALFFGLACGRELRAVVEGRQSRERALARYAAFCAEPPPAFDWLLRVQSLVRASTPRPS